jgi:hypothetical protein
MLTCALQTTFSDLSKDLQSALQSIDKLARGLLTNIDEEQQKACADFMTDLKNLVLDNVAA